MSISPVFSKLEVHPKIWGEELWITNNSKYCPKILRFKEASFSNALSHNKRRDLVSL